jgi:LacI family transcriptional regulator
MFMSVNQKELARRAGVSQVTVSRALRGSDLVSPELREKVLKASHQYGYYPRADARAMRSGKFKRIACIVTRYGQKDVPNFAYVGYLDAATHELAKAGYSLIYEPFCLDSETDDFMEPPRLFTELAVDGILAINSSGIIPPAVDRRIAKIGAPVVWVNRSQTPGISCVTSNEVVNARILTRHLIDLGHRRIGYCCSFGPHHSVTDRPEGIIAELQAAGLETDGVIVKHNPNWDEIVENMLNLQPRRTAIICYNRYFYEFVLHRACRRGWRVPQDLSLCHFASAGELTKDIPMTGLIVPEIAMAKKGVQILMEILSGKTVPDTQEGLVGTLRICETTSAPADKKNILIEG